MPGFTAWPPALSQLGRGGPINRSARFSNSSRRSFHGLRFYTERRFRSTSPCSLIAILIALLLSEVGVVSGHASYLMAQLLLLSLFFGR